MYSPTSSCILLRNVRDWPPAKIEISALSRQLQVQQSLVALHIFKAIPTIKTPMPQPEKIGDQWVSRLPHPERQYSEVVPAGTPQKSWPASESPRQVRQEATLRGRAQAKTPPPTIIMAQMYEMKASWSPIPLSEHQLLVALQRQPPNHHPVRQGRKQLVANMGSPTGRTLG